MIRSPSDLYMLFSMNRGSFGKIVRVASGSDWSSLSHSSWSVCQPPQSGWVPRRSICISVCGVSDRWLNATIRPWAANQEGCLDLLDASHGANAHSARRHRTMLALEERPCVTKLSPILSVFGNPTDLHPTRDRVAGDSLACISPVD
jgi:hypothetical protein